MKVVTRFAPTLSGRMHIGHLVNALYNYVFAKQNNGAFFLRLDGIKLTGERISLQNYFIEDLESFGLVPDFVVKQSDRRELYKERMVSLLERDDVYFCDCSVADITRRASEGATVKIMSRDEKYPAPSDIVQIEVLDEQRINVIHRAKLFANLFTPDHPVRFVLDKNCCKYWSPYDIGYFGNETPIIRLSFSQPTFVQYVRVTFKSYPWREWKVLVDKKEVARVIKANKYCYYPSGGDYPYTGGFKDSVSFAPVQGSELLIMPVKYMRVVRQEYCYDGFCRNRNLSLDLDDSGTVVRTVVDNSYIPDTVLWIRSVGDLALTSAIDDQEFRVTHCFRGYDIEPFTLLEREAGKLINFVPNNIMHGEVLTLDNYKYSKFKNSTPVVDYLKNINSAVILTYIAKRVGLIPNCGGIRTLDQLVSEAVFDSEKVRNHVVLDEGALLSSMK